MLTEVRRLILKVTKRIKNSSEWLVRVKNLARWEFSPGAVFIFQLMAHSSRVDAIFSSNTLEFLL